VNGVHDMGGMDGFGPIPIEQNEPVFHAEWEGRVWSIFLTLLPRLRGFRHAVERIPAPVYPNSSYWERWFNAMMALLVEKGVLTGEELISRGADPIALAQPVTHLKGGRQRSPRKRARFREGDRVIAQHQPYRPYAPPALCAREAGPDSPRLGHICFARQQCPQCWRTRAARLFGWLQGA
jgi:hypothetical protein